MAAIPQDKFALVKKLYYKDKISAVEIAERFSVGVDAVYYFMRYNKLPRRNLSEQNAVRFNRKKPSFVVKKVLSQKEKELRAIGVALYWAEGFQTDYADIVDFANSKPEMILIFLAFLRKVCGIRESKLRVYLYCYSNQNVKKLIKFWSRETKIPSKQFTKPYVRNDFDIKKLGKMPYGLIHIRYGDKKLLGLIKWWINQYVGKFAQIVP